jgi:lipocalin
MCVRRRHAGLWIFTRSPQRDEALIQKAKDLAVSRGFDVSVLNDVQHGAGCRYALRS